MSVTEDAAYLSSWHQFVIAGVELVTLLVIDAMVMVRRGTETASI
jgi:hypothetical protein